MSDGGDVPAEVPTRPAPNGGRLRTGNPGNKGGGRTPDAFKALCRALASRDATVKQVGKILRDPEHDHFMRALQWATEHGYGKATETKKVKHSGGLRVSFGHEGRRGGGR